MYSQDTGNAKAWRHQHLPLFFTILGCHNDDITTNSFIVNLVMSSPECKVYCGFETVVKIKRNQIVDYLVQSSIYQ